MRIARPRRVEAMSDHEPPPMSQPRVAAGALFFDDIGRVLLVKPNYKDGWDIPGGYVEPGETPSESCRREVKEELGLDVDVRRLLVVDWAPSAAEGDKVLFVFDGGTLAGDVSALKLQRDELERAEFHANSSFEDLMPARLARRLLAAVEAQTHSVAPLYLEHGADLATS